MAYIFVGAICFFAVLLVLEVSANILEQLERRIKTWQASLAFIGIGVFTGFLLGEQLAELGLFITDSTGGGTTGFTAACVAFVVEIVFQGRSVEI